MCSFVCVACAYVCSRTIERQPSRSLRTSGSGSITLPQMSRELLSAVCDSVAHTPVLCFRTFPPISGCHTLPEPQLAIR